MQELKLKESVRVTLPTITFDQFDQVLADAKAVADHLETVEVTDENIKESKRMLADVNRGLKALNGHRIQIKKEILKPYDEFANQIKEIEQVVSDADSRVRWQVRELEEKERQAKRAEIKKLWNARIVMYENAKIFEFDEWLSSHHLNKTQSITKTEMEMVEFLEKSERDIQVLSAMDNAQELVYTYRYIRDVAEVIQTHKEKQEALKEQEETLEIVPKDASPTHVFVIKGDKEAKLVELLLKENNIEFERK